MQQLSLEPVLQCAGLCFQELGVLDQHLRRAYAQPDTLAFLARTPRRKWFPRVSLMTRNGQIVGQPRKRECRQNVRKMLRNVRKMSENCPEGLKTQFSDIFGTIFAYLVDAFVGRPVQCSPVTTLMTRWVFLEWGQQNEYRTANVGPSKRNMISHIFFVKGTCF